jgi:hypothetical protein
MKRDWNKILFYVYAIGSIAAALFGFFYYGILSGWHPV